MWLYRRQSDICGLLLSSIRSRIPVHMARGTVTQNGPLRSILITLLGVTDSNELQGLQESDGARDTVQRYAGLTREALSSICNT